MHGIVHSTLEEYVVDRSDEETWETVVDRAGLEPTLYLPVSHYDDDEIDAVLETVAELSNRERRLVERDFGRTLAPELLSTFDAHVREEWTLLDLLASFETLAAAVEGADDETTLPQLSCSRDGDRAVTVTYRSDRDYCALAHGILEGTATAFDADATVTERTCVRNGSEACSFRVVLE